MRLKIFNFCNYPRVWRAPARSAAEDYQDRLEGRAAILAHGNERGLDSRIIIGGPCATLALSRGAKTVRRLALNNGGGGKAGAGFRISATEFLGFETACAYMAICIRVAYDDLSCAYFKISYFLLSRLRFSRASMTAFQVSFGMAGALTCGKLGDA